MEEKKKYWKKFRRYKDAAQYYGVGLKTIEKMAKDAKATYKFEKLVLINCEILENYFELYHVVE